MRIQICALAVAFAAACAVDAPPPCGRTCGEPVDATPIEAAGTCPTGGACEEGLPCACGGGACFYGRCNAKCDRSEREERCAFGTEPYYLDVACYCVPVAP